MSTNSDYFYIVGYDKLIMRWGLPKIARLSHIDNPEDQFALKERILIHLQDVQNELLGMFGFTYQNCPGDVKGYISGIIPTLLEYRLNPTESLKDEVELIFGAIDDMNKNRLKRDLSGIDNIPDPQSDVWMFVV